MESERREHSGREKDGASAKLLEKLREKLYSVNSSTARRAAFNLSWMQEDGLDILKGALFSETARRTKSAAAYGLRKMQGRMRKMALEVLNQGLVQPRSDTKDVCRNALSLVNGKPQERSPSKKAARRAKFKIKEISRKSRQKKIRRKGKKEHLLPKEGFSRR